MSATATHTPRFWKMIKSIVDGRMDITLPGKQKELAEAVIAVGKPTVVCSK